VEREFGVPSIVVTHEVSEVRLLSREAIVLIEGRQAGRGHPDDLFVERETLARLGVADHANVLRGRVAGDPGATAAIDVGGEIRILVPGGGLSAGQEVAVLIRAEDLIVARKSPDGLSAQNILAGTVRDLVENVAEGTMAVTIAARCSRTPLVAALTPQACRRLALEPGRPVWLVFKTQSCRVLPAGNLSKEGNT